MRITGDQILQSVLEVVTTESPRGIDASRDLDVIAGRSGFVIDSINLAPARLGQRIQQFDVTPRRGATSFTWGPNGEVRDLTRQVLDVNNEVDEAATDAAQRDLLPPSEVQYWTAVIANYEQRMTPGGRLTTPKEWLGRDFLAHGQWPRLLFWQRNLNANEQSVFLLAPPATGDVPLRLYATMPAIARVERGKSYDLPQGLAAYLIALLAIDASQPFSFQPTPQMYASLKGAERALASVPVDEPAMPGSPDWMDLDGQRGRYWTRMGW